MKSIFSSWQFSVALLALTMLVISFKVFKDQNDRQYTVTVSSMADQVNDEFGGSDRKEVYPYFASTSAAPTTCYSELASRLLAADETAKSLKQKSTCSPDSEDVDLFAFMRTAEYREGWEDVEAHSHITIEDCRTAFKKLNNSSIDDKQIIRIDPNSLEILVAAVLGKPDYVWTPTEQRRLREARSAVATKLQESEDSKEQFDADHGIERKAAPAAYTPLPQYPVSYAIDRPRTTVRTAPPELPDMSE